ncbi:dipeptide ABC transporter ATP-binding protein [Roseibium sp.]|uniref:ABC transporter ATP-binding protein n=1 Tax=Roseibium sp. TaxID=1936156 RepID=UPI003B50BCB4
MSDPILSVQNLRVSFGSGETKVEAVKGISFDLMPGETLAIVGESGSGKSVSAMSTMALIRQAGGEIDGGKIIHDGRIDMVTATEPEARAIRGNEIAMIFQEPMTSLNPVFSVGEQIIEPLITHLGFSKAEAKTRALAAMDEVRIPEPERRFNQYPHELSGGMRQRVMIAMALVCEPKILIADEPTTALDVTIQAQILWLIKKLKADHGTAVLFITHDLGAVAQIADRVAVMQTGSLVEIGPVEQIYQSPSHPYTRRLLNAVPVLGTAVAKPSVKATDIPMLDLENVSVRYPIRSGLLRQVKHEVLAVDQVSFSVPKRTTLGLVGESGCGKSTIARAVIGLAEPSSGTVRVDGTDTSTLSHEQRFAFRAKTGIVFQDPFAALSPRRTAFDQIAEPMIIHKWGDQPKIRERVRWLLNRVGLSDQHLDRYPHEFSGGQRQRLCIARALALEPDLVIADEPVSALDVSVQAQVLELFSELQRELGLTYLFISHDLAIVEQVSEAVAVMFMGRLVEYGPAKTVLSDPAHDYTRNLLASIPVPDPAKPMATPQLYDEGRKSPIAPKGAITEPIDFREVSTGHFVAAA